MKWQNAIAITSTKMNKTFYFISKTLIASVARSKIV